MARHAARTAAGATTGPRASRRRRLRTALGVALVVVALPSSAYAGAPAGQETTVDDQRQVGLHVRSTHRITTHPFMSPFWWLRTAQGDLSWAKGHGWKPSHRPTSTPTPEPTAPAPTTPAPPAATTPTPEPSATEGAPPPTSDRSQHHTGRGESRPEPSAPSGAQPAPAPAPAIPTSFPNAATTGPRDGHVLAPSGPLTITQPGAVVTDLSVDGCIDVKAPNVTISDVYVDCSRATTAISIADGASATIQYTEINGNGVVSAAVGFANYTLSHVDIHDVIDGPRMNSNVQVLDSFIHALARTSSSHNDTLQTTGGTGIVVRGNTLQAYDPTTGDPHNAAIMIGSENQPLRNMTIEGNYLDGGNYSILARPDLDGSNIVVRSNVFTQNFRYGPYRGATGMTADSSNVFAGTGQPAT